MARPTAPRPGDEEAARAVPDGRERSLASVAAELLSHWWSRPDPAEVGRWLDDLELATEIAAGLLVDEPSMRHLRRHDTRELMALLAEHERLFVGASGALCPPYESYWRGEGAVGLPRRVVGPYSAELASLYRRLGLEPPEPPAALPDHLAVELEALAVALGRAEADELAAELYFAHLAEWYPRFARAVAEATEHEYYRELAALSAAWLEAIAAQLTARPEAG